jgi:hypothetical protein
MVAPMMTTPNVDPLLDPYAQPLQNEVALGANPTPQQRAQSILNRHRQLKAMKAPWMYTWQLLGEFIMTRKQDFTVHITPGMFLTGKIFDSTAPMANHKMASSLLGALWPNAARSFCIHPPDTLSEEDRNSKDVKEYFEWVTHKMAEIMDDPKCGLMLALEEYFYDQGAFGTSGVYVMKNDSTRAEAPLYYKATDAKKIAIAEGADGFVDTCYMEEEMTIRQVVQKYGIDAVSNRTRDAFTSGVRQEEKIMVLHAVEPRIDSLGGFGNRGLPIASVHIEMDSYHILKESGFSKMPVFITRFWKTMNEVYGRSPGMEAMPDILEVNEMREATIVAVEKTLNPPLLVLSDGALGGQVINTSAGAISVHNVSGRIANSNLKPIEPLITVGELKDTYAETQHLQQIIERNFFIDLLTDLNNESRQTLGEAQIRDKLREQALIAIFSRQISELFSRLVERTFDILFEKKMLGVVANSEDQRRLAQANVAVKVIPPAIVKLIGSGMEGYKIRFISPAARAMRREELNGIQQSLTAIMNMAPTVPDIVDTINTDKAAEMIVELSGAPTKILNDLDTIKALRQNRAQMQQQQMQAQQKEQGALTMKHTAQAAESATKAGIPIQNLFGQNQGEPAA